MRSLQSALAVFFVILAVIGLNSCVVPSPGTQDYSLDLPGHYTLRRTSSDVIYIQYKQKENLSVGTNGAIRYFAFDDEYIFFETEVLNEDKTKVIETLFSAVNYNTHEYFEEKSFDRLSDALDLDIISYEMWLSTKLSDIDWTDPDVANEYLEKGYA